MKVLRVMLIAMLCSTLIIVLSSLSQSLDALVYTTYDHVSTLDPVYAAGDSASAAINMMVYESLIRPTWLLYGTEQLRTETEKEVDFLPMLATAVPSVENGLVRFRSDGGVDYHFPIRQGVKFHNGAELTPEDVEYTYERAMILDPDIWWSGLDLLFRALLDTPSIESLAWDIAYEKGITGIWNLEDLPENVLRETCLKMQQTVEVDGNKVIFHLRKDYKEVATFLSILAHGDQPFNHIVNKKWTIEQGGWPGTCDNWVKWHHHSGSAPRAELHDKMNGTGPFKLWSWIPNQEVRLVAHDDYWDGRPKLREFIRREVTCPVTRRAMILGGRADIANIPPAELSEIIGQPGIRVQGGLPLAAVTPVIFFNTVINTENNPFIGSGMLDGKGIPKGFFADVNVRKAFAYAFDYDEYVAWYYEEVLKGPGELNKWTSPIPSIFANYYYPAGRYYFSPTKAKELFKSGPWGEYSEVWNTGFYFIIPYSQGNQIQKKIAELIKAGIELLNPKFHIEVREVSGGDYLEYMLDYKMPIFIAGWFAYTRDPDDFVSAFMASWGFFMPLQTGGLFTGCGTRAEEVYDPLIKKAASTTNVEERQKLYFELQKLAFEDAMQIYLPQATDQRVFSTWVVDLPWSPMWAEIFVWNMTVKRK